MVPISLCVDRHERYEVTAPGSGLTSLGLPLLVGVSVKALGAWAIEF
jgi:hypothetical protein